MIAVVRMVNFVILVIFLVLKSLSGPVRCVIWKHLNEIGIFDCSSVGIFCGLMNYLFV